MAVTVFKRAAGLIGVGLIVLATACVVDVPPASANWLTKLVRESGETAGTGARHGVHVPHGIDVPGPVGRAARHLSITPDAPKAALAAHATPEGHWQFVNREGKTYTAGTPDEINRAASVLLPEDVVSPQGRLTLYLSEESLFDSRQAMQALPVGADLHVTTRSGTYPVRTSLTGRGADASALRVEIRPNVHLATNSAKGFEEALSYMTRPLNKANIRTLAIDTSATGRLSSAPRIDPATKLAQVDRIAPTQLSDALSSLRGQTAVLVGRVDNGMIQFGTSGGSPISIDDLVASARRHDVDLVILHTDSALQPGGRNWFWQKVGVKGLDKAAKKQTVADFFNAVGSARGGFDVQASDSVSGRIHIAAHQAVASPDIVSETSNWMAEAVAQVTGKVISQGIDAYVRDKAERTEQDRRIIPGIPSSLQFAYLFSVIAGLAGHTVSFAWWAKIWPKPVRAADASRVGHVLTWLLRSLVLVLAFLPVFGIPALIVHLVRQAWAIVSAPFRWLRRLFTRAEI